MLTFCEDDAQIANFPNEIVDEPREPDAPFIQCLQWDTSERQHGAENQPRDLPDAQSLIDLAEERQRALRVVSLPIRPASYSEEEPQGFEKLIEYYSIPSAVLAERMRTVTCSFGNLTLAKRNAEVSWCQFVCRNVDVKDGMVQDLVAYLDEDQGKPCLAPRALGSTCHFYLHVRHESTEGSGYEKAVTLLCFDAPREVVHRFQRLLHNRDAWCEILLEPYLLFDVLFDELHDFFDKKVWNLSAAVSPEEKSALMRADTLGSVGGKIDFQSLHNTQK
jgi:hypothetical protein